MTYKTILLVVGISQLEDDLRAAADLCASEGGAPLGSSQQDSHSPSDGRPRSHLRRVD